MAYPQYATMASDLWGISPDMALGMLTIIGIWSLIWKGFALWRAAGKRQLVWFIVFLIINTAGVLEILYLFVLSKMDGSKNKKKDKKKRRSKERR